ncbi:MAG: dipicolinate synthase subunit DpsA [Oscillospiraceae bacterium]|nr:dipicolinate synthase subunit DpsA [Oscillospiraceae bacterium]
MKYLKDLKYLIIGGDERSAYLADELIKDNKNIKIILDKNFCKTDQEKNIELAIKDSDVIIFPLPISKDGQNLNINLEKNISLEKIIDKIDSNKIVLGGGASEKIKNIFNKKNINFIDYLDREELAVLNAVPTAEGAVEIAMRKLPITIYNSRCLVTGFGRVSKALVNILLALKSKVTVVARKHEDLAWASILGCKTFYFKDFEISVRDQDIIFNTVPSKIINKNILDNIKQDCLIIDLASKPGGVDLKSAQELDIKIETALALPGKVAPKTAGKIIKQTIDNILSEILV